MSKTVGFNQAAVTQSRRSRPREAVAYIPAQISIDRGNQTRRQKRLKVTMPSLSREEKPK